MKGCSSASGRTALAVLLALAGAGCGLRSTAAWDPDAQAPASSSAPWSPPPGTMAAATPHAVPSLPDPQREYDLPELIGYALQQQPDTRRAWEEARAAAARLGQAEAAYAPQVALEADGGWSQVVNATPKGTEVIRAASLEPRLWLTWVLLDFGRRSADREQARQELIATNLGFNRTLQQVVFGVQRTFFALDAARARVAAAEATLRSATAVREAADARSSAGLATETEVLLARQEEARAAFEREAALGAVADAKGALAEQLGITPTAPLRVTDLSREPLPAPLPGAVEGVIDDALLDRPDLAARLAELRAREAAVKRAQAAWWPTLRFAGGTGGALRRYRAGPPFGTFTDDDPTYAALLVFEWKLFDGGERANVLREAEATRGAAAARYEAEELAVLREVWKAYADTKTAERKLAFADALLAASEEAYEAALGSYRAGIGTSLVELLAAERDLARARMTVIESRAELLTAAAGLAFAAGAQPSPGTQARSTPP